jgi:hypothetical protein
VNPFDSQKVETALDGTTHGSIIGGIEPSEQAAAICGIKVSATVAPNRWADFIFALIFCVGAWEANVSSVRPMRAALARGSLELQLRLRPPSLS